jgi:TonB family protein
MKQVLIYPLLLVTYFSNAQVDTVGAQKYTPLERIAEPKGGMMKVFKVIMENHKYPKEAKLKMVEGKVWIEFVVNEDGSLSDFIVTKGLGFGCDEEAIRLMKLVGTKVKWIPGMQKGVPVKSKFGMPVIFKLGDDKKLNDKRRN